MNEIMRTNELQHHGILGMKWGVRRYQNKDGTLTEEGKKRYRDDEQFRKEYASERIKKGLNGSGALEEYNKAVDKFNPELEKLNKAISKDLGMEDPEYIQAVNQLWKKTYEDVFKEDYGQYLEDLGIDFYEAVKLMPLYSMLDEYELTGYKHA